MQKRRINFIEASMKHRQVTFFITAVLVMAGIVALLTMPRSENPRFEVRQALVVAAYPGADEEQVEKQVTNQLEQYLFGFDEIKKGKTKSETKDGLTVITAELQDYVTDPKKFWGTLQHGLNTSVRPNLPAGVVGPLVNSDFGDVVTEMITVAAPGRSYADLERYLDRLEDGIKTMPNVSKIKRYGGQKQQIYITLDNEKLRQYGFDVATITRVLQAENTLNYTGDVQLSASNVPIFSGRRYPNEVAVGNQIVYSTPTGQVVRLKDVATLTRRYEEPKSFITVGNDRVMMLTVEMQPGKNVVGVGRDLDARLAELKKTLPADVRVRLIVDQPKVVQASINHFMMEFLIAIVAVIGVVMLLLPLHMAAVSAIAAPVSIAITFAVVNVLGIELHQVTLAALVIVLGMVVDDAIVVVDNYIEKLDEGLPRWQAAWQSATQLMVPIFTATIAIVFAFMPLALFLNGVGKDFMRSLPITIMVALSASLLVALLLTPYLCYVFLRKGIRPAHGAAQPGRRNLLDWLQLGFDKSIDACFRWPRLTLLGGVVTVALAVFVASGVEQEMFPTAVRNQFNAELWMDNGTNVQETAAAARKVATLLEKDQRVVNTASFIGTSSPRFHSNYSPETPRENYAQIFINTVSPEATDELVQEYLRKFRNYLPNGEVRLRQLSFKDTPAPVEIRVIGERLADQKRVAEQVRAILEKARGTNWVRTDYQGDYFGLKATVREDEASRLGVSSAAIAQTLGAGLNGYLVSTLWEGDKPVDLLLRLDPHDRAGLGDLPNIAVSSQYGTKVPLKDVVAFTPAWHTGVIAHLNGLRTLTVRSEAQLGVKAATILAAVKPQLAKLRLPPGITLGYGGEEQSAQESAPGMGASLLASFGLIFLTLLVQFKSLSKVLIILVTFPLSLLGAMLGLSLTGNPMGFPAFMGIISLMGIVVRNGIILVDFTDELVRDHGLGVREAALAAAKRRMRPVFLTSAAAAVGLLPMIIGHDSFWSPLGSVLAIGVLVSMVTTLHIVPVLYYRFIKQPTLASPAEPWEAALIQSEVVLHH
ncbi:MAG: efflux RND transporter permease subunit [Janthinobacterium lividum]